MQLPPIRLNLQFASGELNHFLQTRTHPSHAAKTTTNPGPMAHGVIMNHAIDQVYSQSAQKGLVVTRPSNIRARHEPADALFGWASYHEPFCGCQHAPQKR